MKKRIALIIITLTLFTATTFITNAFGEGVALTTPINVTLPATGAGAALITLDDGINAASYAIQARGRC